MGVLGSYAVYYTHLDALWSLVLGAIGKERQNDVVKFCAFWDATQSSIVVFWRRVCVGDRSVREREKTELYWARNTIHFTDV